VKLCATLSAAASLAEFVIFQAISLTAFGTGHQQTAIIKVGRLHLEFNLPPTLIVAPHISWSPVEVELTGRGKTQLKLPE
jgi:hypothetical protein